MFNSKLFSIVFCMLSIYYSYAQNAVLNPSFEDTVHCPTTPSQLNYTKYWTSPTTANPDYLNACSSGVHVPNNGWGNQVAHSGVAYAGFYAYNTVHKNYKEYLQEPLSTMLLSNHKYFVSFYVSLAELSQYVLSSVGVYFSSSPISSTSSLTLNYTPQIQNPSTNMLSDKTNWMLVADTLYANGGEQFITIGNFKADSLSDTLYLGFSSSANVAYYFIDDVSIIDYGLMGIENYKNKGLVNIYPNPANEILNIETNEEQGEIKITDLLGNQIKSEKINKNLKLDVSNLSKGVYFVTFVSGKNISTQKIIVQH